jgi:hypothetical protein
MRLSKKQPASGRRIVRDHRGVSESAVPTDRALLTIEFPHLDAVSGFPHASAAPVRQTRTLHSLEPLFFMAASA